MTNGPARSQHQAIPADDPERPSLLEAARRAFIARSAALAQHSRTEFVLSGLLLSGLLPSGLFLSGLLPSGLFLSGAQR